jgi:hypothetical protein
MSIIAAAAGALILFPDQARHAKGAVHTARGDIVQFDNCPVRHKFQYSIPSALIYPGIINKKNQLSLSTGFFVV